MPNTTHRRLATVVAAPFLALAGWAIVRLIGVDLVVKHQTGTVNGADVVVAATVAGLLAWVVVRQLERRVRRPRQTWSLLASTGLAVSIIGPSWLADGGSAVALISLHLVTAAVLIVGFSGTLPWRQTGRAGLRRSARANPKYGEPQG